MKNLLTSSWFITRLAAGLMILSAAASAATFTFATDPFLGSTAPTTPGRQIVGGEQVISFSIASDVFSFDPMVFGLGPSLTLANETVGTLPASGANVIVLQTFDNDGDPTTVFAAATAANLIADQLTSSTAGFFLYFNSGLDLPRLVYTPDLSDNTSDLKILARLSNLEGQTGRDAMATFTSANFQVSRVPELGGTWMYLMVAFAAFVVCRRGKAFAARPSDHT